MTLDEERCWRLLAAADRAVLGTVHRDRGVDAVPVVFALLPGRRIVVPIDTVKPKGTTRLQRLVNVELDHRCVLLVDHYDTDWSRLWWVRAHATAVGGPPTPEALEALAAKYAPYRADGAVAAALVLTPTALTGWAAA